jgi:LPXTG-motif cell wall-anchored protein
MLQQVSEKLLGQFVDALEAKLAAGDEVVPADVVATPATLGAEALGTPAAAAAPRVVPAPEPEPIDLLQLAGGTAVPKYAAAGLAALVILILIVLLRRRRTE